MLLSAHLCPGVEVKITDDNGHLQPVGQRGNIFIRSKKRFTGYLNNKLPPSTEDLLMKSGWFYPKDDGYVSEDKKIKKNIPIRDRKCYQSKE